MNKVNRYKKATVNKIVALVIGVISFLSLFMPFMEASAMGFSQTVSIKEYLELQDDGSLGIIMVITIISILIYVLLQLTSHPRISIIGAIGMLLLAILWLAVYAMEKSEGYRVEVDPKIGLFINVLCAIAAMVFVFIKPLGQKNQMPPQNMGGYGQPQGYDQYGQQGYDQYNQPPYNNQ